MIKLKIILKYDGVIMKLKKKITYKRFIILGFLILIAIGTLLLTLPIASKDRSMTPLFDALFTATSASCVTGLVVFDTFSHWSLFGQTVILLLIQIGGLGVISVISMFSIALGRRIGLQERQLIAETAGSGQLGGMVRLIKRIFLITLIVEGAGAVLLFIRFCPMLGVGRGLYYAVFHSVSAFCNAGFDLFGFRGEYASLTPFSGDVLVNAVIMLLIIIGGIGFPVWDDLIKKKLKFKKYDLHTKIVLSVSFILIFGGAALFYIFERYASLEGMTGGNKILSSLFQSVTARTAGFNTVDLTKLSKSGCLLMTSLMTVGGSPASTAGGIKTTTLAVLFLNAYAAARHTKSISLFNRRLHDNVAEQACAVITIFVTAVFASLLFMCAKESIGAENILFEIVSAAGTVGLAKTVTAALLPASKVILILLMFGGRVGGVTLMLSLAEKCEYAPVNRPEEKILIG